MADGDRSGRVTPASPTATARGGLVALLLASVAVTALAEACPDECYCRWKGGKKTVECVDRRLESLPADADADTQVLDISGHSLMELTPRAFQQHGLLALQRIFVSRGRLTTIDSRAFSGLTNLVELDLSENRLTGVPGAALRDVPALRRLSLSGNPLEQVRRGDLSALRELTSLELAQCQLRVVEKGAFATLLRLEWLQLQGNQLSTLSSVDLSLHLHGVQLQGNGWQCDCRLRELRGWLRRYPVPLTVPPRCSAPRRLAGRAVHNTSSEELACAPDIRPADRLFEVPLNSSVVLSCAAQADPAAELDWSFNGRLLDDGTADDELGYFITETSELGGDGGGAVRRSQLVIPSAGEHDHGVFRCRAENAAGAATADYRVRVLLPPDTRSSGSAPASRSHLALPVGGSLVLLAASALLLLGALAIRRGRRLRRRRKFRDAARDAGEGDGAESPTGSGGGVSATSAGGVSGVSRAVSRDTTLTDCHEHQLQEIPVRHPPHCARDRGPDVLCDAGDSATAVVVERGPPPPSEQTGRVIQDLSWPPAWTLNPNMSVSHGNIYGESLLRRSSMSAGSYHRHLCEAPAGGQGHGPPLGWRSLPRPARPRPPPSAPGGGSPERWRRSVMAIPQMPQYLSGAPQLVAVDPARVCSCMLGPSLEGRLWQLPACRAAGVQAVPAPPPPPWPTRVHCGGTIRPRCRCLAPDPSAAAAAGPLAPPAGFGDELPPPGPHQCAPPRWPSCRSREHLGAAPAAVFIGRPGGDERLGEGHEHSCVHTAPDA